MEKISLGILLFQKVIFILRVFWEPFLSFPSPDAVHVSYIFLKWLSHLCSWSTSVKIPELKMLFTDRYNLTSITRWIPQHTVRKKSINHILWISAEKKTSNTENYVDVSTLSYAKKKIQGIPKAKQLGCKIFFPVIGVQHDLWAVKPRSWWAKKKHTSVLARLPRVDCSWMTSWPLAWSLMSNVYRTFGLQSMFILWQNRDFLKLQGEQKLV